MWCRILLGVAGAAWMVAAAPVQAAPVLACADLAKHNFSDIPDAPTAIVSAVLVAATDHNPSYCRVRGNITPNVGFELRLPLEQWNGKFFMQGCRGYCGEIEIEEADDALNRGYATAITDMGHTGTEHDAIWAYNNRPAEIDFAFRATHVSVLAAKTIIGTFEGKVPGRSYFRGCGTGGRQGLVEAETFPADFDGIIAGAPAELKRSVLDRYWSAAANLDSAKRAILSPQLAYLLRGAVMAKCDAFDGLKDGILEDPRQCTFDPRELACKGFTAGGLVPRSDCLTPAQVDAARKLYNGPVTGDGARLAPGGLMPGSELTWLGNIIASDGGPGQDLKVAEDALRFIAFAEDPGPAFGIEQFDLDRDAPRLNFMDRLMTGSNPDLRGFRDRGGRMIMYRGWQDGPALNTVDFYEQVADVMEGLDQTQPFFRLFMVPGMNHCGGGPGANTFDFITAIEDWTEFGKAPDSLMGAHREENGVLGFSRPVYAYPDFAHYDGPKDHVVPEGFKRQSPKP